MKTFILLAVMMQWLPLFAANCLAINKAVDSLPQSVRPVSVERTQAQKAKTQIRAAGLLFTGALGVTGAAFKLRDDEKERDADVLGKKGRHTLSSVLFAVSGLLLVGALVTFISWLGMPKKDKKPLRTSFHAPSFSPPGTLLSAGIAIRLGR